MATAKKASKKTKKLASKKTPAKKGISASKSEASLKGWATRRKNAKKSKK